jgi:tRNA modification GTPase
MPAVGIAGVPNAGKSSLLNKLLGTERSIVSEQSKTTIDVLTGLLTLRHCRCVLFDCAGLTTKPNDILDELAQTAAIKALANSSVVVFCVDISKADWAEDIAIRSLVEPNPPGPALIPVATKSDLLSEDVLAERLSQVTKLFGTDFFATSAKDGTGLEQLKDIIDNGMIELSLGCTMNTKNQIQDTRYEVALTARHRSAVTEAIDNIRQSIDELKAGNDEIAAMMLRAAHQAVSNIERENVDEQILEQIFKRFCIGK